MDFSNVGFISIDNAPEFKNIVENCNIHLFDVVFKGGKIKESKYDPISDKDFVQSYETNIEVVIEISYSK